MTLLIRSLRIAASIVALQVFLLASAMANAATINFSVPTPYLGLAPDAAGLVLDGPSNSGTITLTPGIAQNETIWLYDTLGGLNGDFANDNFALNLILNGISVPVPVIANHTGFTFSYVPGGTAMADLAGIGVVSVTILPYTASFADPLHAGPGDARFLLQVTSVPEPTSSILFAIGLLVVVAFRQKHA